MSIHSLGGIIENLEKRLSKYKVDEANEKQKISMLAQAQLINQLKEVYEEYNYITMWETFLQIQQEANAITSKDAEIEGLIIRIKFKANANIMKFGFIDFTI